MAQKSKLDKSRSCDRILSIGGNGLRKSHHVRKKNSFCKEGSKMKKTIVSFLFFCAMFFVMVCTGYAFCEPDGWLCVSDKACCSRVCFKTSPAKIGTCCSPTTCAAQGANCGSISDGCGGTVDCGTCTGYDTCGGGGIPNVCGCRPRTCADVGASCGTVSDGCGGTLNCENKRCTSDVDCSSTETCWLIARSYGNPYPICIPKVGYGRACVTYGDCFSGCCCYGPSDLGIGIGGNAFSIAGQCLTLYDCNYFSGDATWCPGTPCGQDQDCPGSGITQYCTGGLCRAKEQNGNGCVYSAGCFSGCCCTSTSTCQDLSSCSSGCNP